MERDQCVDQSLREPIILVVHDINFSLRIKAVEAADRVRWPQSWAPDPDMATYGVNE